MKPKKISRDLLVLATLTVLVVFTWIGFDVYRRLHQSTPPKIPPEQLVPLDPKLETQILENLSQREMFDRQELILPQVTPQVGATESGRTTRQ